ncbi:Guanylate kinase [Coccomyxa sp. Obi]|nr:Guanylate kinase [Coccomyxa sp. Obi]
MTGHCSTSASPAVPKFDVLKQGTASLPGRSPWHRTFRMAVKNSAAASGESYSTAELYRAVEDHLGKLSTTPSIPSLEPVKVVISGPSGVGKDAVIKALQASRPDLHFVVTATSRPKRPGEVDGVDYFFVSKEQFEEWIRSEELVEWALVYGEYKGIPKAQVLDALARGTDVIFRLDIQGAQTVRRKFPDAVSIFLVAESEAALVKRLIDRKTEPMDKMITRVETARQEMQHIGEFDYVVLNRDGDLQGAVQQIDAIISAERHRTHRIRWHDSASNQPPSRTADPKHMLEMQKC